GAYQYFNYLGNSWGVVNTLSNGFFQSGPAVACALAGVTEAEIAVWGMDIPPGNGLVYSTQITSGNDWFNWAGITIQANSWPTAATFGGQWRIGVRVG